MTKVKIMIGIAEKFVKDNTDVSIRISPIKLIVGGALMLAALARNHQNVIEGNRAIIPLVKNSLRVFVVW